MEPFPKFPQLRESMQWEKTSLPEIKNKKGPVYKHVSVTHPKDHNTCFTQYLCHNHIHTYRCASAGTYIHHQRNLKQRNRLSFVYKCFKPQHYRKHMGNKKKQKFRNNYFKHSFPCARRTCSGTHCLINQY